MRTIFRNIPTNAAEHVINLNVNQQPIYQRPYRLPHSQQAEIKQQLDKMQKDGIIEPSSSPRNAPILLVRKKIDASGKEKFRIVIDFRALYQVTLNEFHPLPNITEILDHLGQCQLFSVIDLASGFYQIPLSESSRELTAFSANNAHYQFRRMARGLKLVQPHSKDLWTTCCWESLGLSVWYILTT